MATTQTIVTEKTNAVAEAIEGHSVYVCDDGAGPYLSIHTYTNEEEYSCASLTDEGQCGDDLSKYRWNFWNHQSNTHADSELGSDTEIGDVLAFVTDMLNAEQEKRENAG